jgi:amidase
MRIDEYTGYDGMGLAKLVQERDVTAVELSNIAVSAMRSINAKLNFVVAETAGAAKEQLESLRLSSPFAGVPTLMKDVGPTFKGVPQEMACELARGFVPSESSELASRYLAAGLIFIGRSNTPELGSAFTTEPRMNGPTLNPWDISLSPGGSSGGAAVAVATGVVPLALGGDTGGSIRVPAHCCGLFGLKPSRGRNPMGPGGAEGNSGMTVPHVITRTVRDSAAVLDATAGPDPGCKYFAAPPKATFLDCVDRPQSGLRIAFSTKDYFGDGVDSEIADAVRNAAKACAELGHHVEEADPPFDPDIVCDVLEVLSAGNSAFGLDMLAAGRPISSETVEEFNLAMYRRGKALSAEEYVQHLDKMNGFSRTVGRFFVNYDAVITPPFSKVGLKLNVLRTNDPIPDLRQYVWDHLCFAGHTVQYNLTGQPAASLPLYESRSGLPIGVQIATRYADEETLFSIAGQLEKALPWHRRRPSIFAQN